jgi:predicted ATPase/class 3 adenylate cyclase
MTPDPSSPFGDLLRRYRVAAGLTQEELAERAGLSRRGIADLESGARRRPRRDTVALLATALGVSETERVRFEASARGGMERQTATQSAVSALPSGTVTFLFTDLEGATLLLQQLGAARYAEALETVRRLLRAACAQHQGHEVDATGDGSFFAFAQAPAAVAAAALAQRAITAQIWPDEAPVRVRMGLHSGTAQVVGDHYIGLDVHRAARIAAAGHGGQTLLSWATCALVEADLPDGVALRELGAHRLKDLQRPERLAQLVLPDLPADFPPLNALDRHAHNLPIQPTPLLGRAREVAAVVALLRRDDVRLVTLTGPGGVGKTRLAMQVAAELVDHYADGVWFVRLSRLTDPELVLPTIAQTLGLQEAGSRTIQELLRDYVRARQLLLLLDNCEQVVATAPLVAEVLASSQGLAVVATSRTPLHLQGELEYPVPPLALPIGVERGTGPSLEQVTRSPAVALFVERARAHRPDFRLTKATASAVAAICARLDGLPLAIELAAGRLKVLPPTVLLQRLERHLPLLTGGTSELEARQQTMRGTLAWSEDLLQPEERRLFRRLAVFVGGFTLEAAEAVCAAPAGAEPLGSDVLEGLGTLVDQSLVQTQMGNDEEGGEARYRLLSVVREYALERLETGEEGAGGQTGQEAEALRRAHAICVLAFVTRSETDYTGVKKIEVWLTERQREHDNIRAALSWALAQGDAEFGLQLATAVWRFWRACGFIGEGLGWLQRLLELAEQREVPGDLRAKSLYAAGSLAHLQGDDSAASAWLEAITALSGADLQVVGGACGLLGDIAVSSGDYERATEYYEQSLSLYRVAADQVGIAAALANLAEVARYRGNRDDEAAFYQEALALGRHSHDPMWQVIMGTQARRQGDHNHALALAREALAHYQSMGAHLYIATTLEHLATTGAASGRSEWVARLLGAVATLREAIGTPRRADEELDTDVAIAAARAALGEERWGAAYAAGRALSLEEAVAEALDEAAWQ